MSALNYLSRALQTATAVCALFLLVACSGSSGGDDNTCTLGALGCACNDDACDDGLTCSEGVCYAEGSVTLDVTDDRARGCEVLLAENGASIVGVDFGEGVRGAYVREQPSTSIAFIAGGDHAIGAGQITVRFEDDGLAAPSIRAVRCTDKDGAPIEGAGVEIRG